MADERKGSLVLVPLVGVYVLCLLLTLSHLGDPFPFMGKLYSGDASESYIFVDSIVSVYLIFGILKRQRLTLWLLIAYNFVKSLSGLANLLLLPVQHIANSSGLMVPDYEYRLNAFWVMALFLLLNVFLYFNRRNFDNESPYLW
jgi:hypothetical protein